MFTGIVETMVRVEKVRCEGTNKTFAFSCPFSNELGTDQSVAHNGVCLTVESAGESNYTVTAVKETLDRSNLGLLQPGDLVNIERCMKLDGRLDGHIVQGHVDQTATVSGIIEEAGSWVFHLEYDAAPGNLTVEKGSISVNGVSLTVVESETGRFSVAIIPYTYEHTNFHTFNEGTVVNLEFDIIGKYIAALMNKGGS